MKKIICLFSVFLLFFAISAYAVDRTPTYSNTTNAADLDLWGGWDGTTMTKVAGESGAMTDVLIAGGTTTSGCIFSLNAGNCASGTHSNSKYKGFIDATELVIRYKSDASMRGSLVLDYRISPTKTLTTKSFSLPNTNGQWSNLVVPFSALEPDTDGKWVYNINGEYQTTNFNPVVEFKLEGVNFGATHTATISSITCNWYQEDMVRDIRIDGQKTTYMQNYDNFDYKTGKITFRKGDTSVDVNGSKVLSGQTSSLVGLKDGNITIESKAKDGTTKDYQITVNSAASSNADLERLTTNFLKLDQPFDPNVTDYTMTLPNSTEKIRFYPKPYDTNATSTVNGSAEISSSGYGEVTIADGTKIIPIVVIAQDGTTKTYRVTTIKGASDDNNANLYSISLSKGYLDQPFDPNATEYTATVSNSTTSVTVCPIKEDANSTITVNGAAVSSNANSAAINLAEGVNVITVLVTAKNTAITKTYTFTVTRADLTTENNANLFSVALTVGTLNKSIDRNVTEYAAKVEGNATSIKITPTVETNATIKVNGVSVNSGSQSGSINLPAGSDTIIPVVVTSKDGTIIKTYNFTITRKPVSSDSTLFNLKLSNGKLSQTFDSNVLAYTVNVANGVSSMQVTPFKSNSYASIKVNNTTVSSGSASAAIALAVGDTQIKVEVTAQDGTKKTYTVTFKRAATDDTNANLFNVTLSKGILISEFDPTITTYQAQVSSDTDLITVTPIASDSNATIKVNGNAVANGSASGNILIASGDNAITIEVTAKDGTVKTYTITASRIAQTDTNAELLSMNFSGGILSPAFSPEITQYTLTVPQSIGKVTVTPVKQSVYETIETVALDDTRVSISGFNNKTLNDNLRITVTVLNSPITYNVSIVPFTLPQSVDFTVDSPKLSYYVNDSFDFTTGKIIVHYTDKPEEQITLNNINVTITGFDASVESHDQVITVTYGGKSVTYKINVINFVVGGPINAIAPKKLYKVGETFDWHTGTIVPKSGASAKLFSRYATVIGFDSSVPVQGQVITITYGGQTTTYTIDITDKEIPVKYYLEQTMAADSRPACWQWGSSFKLGVVDGKAEDGMSPAIYSTGDGTHGGGGAIVFMSGDFGNGNVTMSDGTVLSGFVGADAIKIRYCYVGNTAESIKYPFTIEFSLEYDSDGSKNVASGKISLPSTNGEWKDIIMPLSSFDDTDKSATSAVSIDWLYNMKTQYTTGFNPYVELRVNGKMGDGDYLAIDNMKFLWYEDKSIESISVAGVETQYHQYARFNSSKGQVIVHYKDGSTRTTTLADPGIVFSGFNSELPATDQEITITYAGVTTTYKINVAEGVGNPYPEYVSQQFVTIDGFDMYSFDGTKDVVAKINLSNPDTIAKRPYGVLFVVAYNGNKVVAIKSFELKDIPQGTSALTVTYTKEELTDVTKLKIVALKDDQNQQPIFDKAVNISKLII